MQNSIIADTGYWYALLNEDDHFHHLAVDFLQNLDSQLISTWPVITETSYLLQTRLGQMQVCEFLDAHSQGLYRIYDLSAGQVQRMVVLMQKYADLPMDLADASLVILAEELGHGRILSTDQRDFNAYRWKNRKPFRNLLLPDENDG
ncbi:MAG: type II toxin-antitoxin system VapC family toxin [Gammaproteobacteria bacterium]